MHASSDGVFRPDVGDRNAVEPGDATDDYGASKCAGERAVLDAGGLVIRCSIVGPEVLEPQSLLGWLLRQEGEIRGFTNHLWNGITTLEWARVCLGPDQPQVPSRPASGSAGH